MKKALITGIGGQDGSYLAEYLLSLGYEVHGTLRMVDLYQRNLENVVGKVGFYYADLRDEVSLEKVIRRVHPDEIYNLAGQVFVPTSWSQPGETFDANVGGLARILKIVENVCKKCRVYQASTSEMYGNIMLKPRSIGITTMMANRDQSIDEEAPMTPVSPYGVSKLAAHKLVDVYRQKGMYVVSGILFNHESPRRGEEMVTRKITRCVARWMAHDWVELRLGNPESRRDWGFAGDYVKAMHKMLQPAEPKDYVVGTGQAHSVADFLSAARWAGGFSEETTLPVTLNAPEFARPAELHCLIANYSKAKRELGWEPDTNFHSLVKKMVSHDYEMVLAEQGKSSVVGV